MLFDIKDDEIHRIRDVFATFDEDNSGSITIKELGNIYDALGDGFTEKELITMMDNIDLNEDGFITFDEFLNLYKNKVFFNL